VTICCKEPADRSKKRAPAIAPIAIPILAPVEREEELEIVGWLVEAVTEATEPLVGVTLDGLVWAAVTEAGTKDEGWEWKVRAVDADVATVLIEVLTPVGEGLNM
jgi:hypothetical protein